MDEALQDERFSHILTDPRFRKMPKNIRKVAIDKRFKGMFRDKKFKGKCMFDKRGRPLDLTPSEDLKKLYEVSSESSASEDDEEDRKNQKEIHSESDSGNLSDEIKEEKQTSLEKGSIKGNSKITTKSLAKNKSKVKTKSVNSENKNSTFEDKFKEDNSKSTKKQKAALYDNGLSKAGLKTKESNKKLNVKNKKNISPEGNKAVLEKVQNNKTKHLKQNTSINKKVSFSKDDDSNELSDETDQSLKKENSMIKHKEQVIIDYKNSSLRTEIKNQDPCSDASESSEEEENLLGDDVDKADSSEDSDDGDDSESDSSSGDISEDFDHQWEELRNEAPDTDEITHRIAVCNMDWDRIRAEDLFACFNSFKPADGYIKSIKIYPSEYGLKRMEEERINGPPELVEETLPSDDEEIEDKKGSKYHREKLRQYQINRLKYYYAVIDCDSTETANALYDQLNGMEYESSSVRFDLRFIPDDVTFDHDPISVADKPPNPAEYKPKLFVTSALQQVKVNLTWDETDPKRRETLQKAFTEPDDIEQDIKDYLASSSSESEDANSDVLAEDDTNGKLNTKDKIAKYRELLFSLEEKEKDKDNEYEMEITWEPGFKEKTEEIVKEKINKDNLTPFDEMVQRKKEERKLKRKEQKVTQKQDDDWDSSDSDGGFFTKASVADEKDQNFKRLAELALISDSKKETNFEEKVQTKNKKSKFKKGKQNLQTDNFKMDVNDPRFSAIYSSHLYNIDPSDPHYKDTDGNRAFIQEKQRKLNSSKFSETNRNAKKARYF